MTVCKSSCSLSKDIIQLINGDSAHWLVGISDVPKTFGLELLDTVLTDFSPVFFKVSNSFRTYATPAESVYHIFTECTK